VVQSRKKHAIGQGAVKVGAVFDNVDTRVPARVEDEVHRIYMRLFPDAVEDFVPRAFGWATQCFSGGCDGYQGIDVRYHDFEHTLQGTLCLARLLAGRQAAAAEPAISRRMLELCLLAMLFHDSGYLKRREDREGTGAKYTAVHVARSISFAREFLGRHGYAEEGLRAVENMIRCTGVEVDLQSIPFQNEVERVAGCALGTADLLGQMAAPDYVEKLPGLYAEFAEAGRFDPASGERFTEYGGADDLMRRTPTFWSGYVWPRLNEDFGRLYRFLNDPFPDGPNAYVNAVQRNIARLQDQLKGS
jgi:hypothetical protein